MWLQPGCWRAGKSSPGIGENSGSASGPGPPRRSRYQYNEEENAKRSLPAARDFRRGFRYQKVLVIPTNEEKAIAEATEELVKPLSRTHDGGRLGVKLSAVAVRMGATADIEHPLE